MPIPILSEPPGTNSSYVLPVFNGELWTIPTSNSVMRMLVTEKESKGDFAVVSTGGQQDNPIGFHYHREAHDVFLCLKGSMNVWANDSARTLLPGDFASVPPNVVHQYQILGSHTEFAGLIVPGGWEEFFRFIGEPYATSPMGPLFPTRDNRNPMEVLVPKLIAATEKFDMVPKRDHKGAEPILCTNKDNKLSNSATEPYFLKADAGPRYASGGLLVKPLCQKADSNGKFSIARLEGSATIKSQYLAYNTLTFETSHHCFLVDMGSFRLTVDGQSSEISAGETIFVPAGQEFTLEVASRYAALYVFTNGGGLVEMLVGMGKGYDSQIIAEDFPTDAGEVDGLQEKVGVKVGEPL
ncbi:cupin domain-containing protein, partial [Aureobasidium melanogenum]